MAGYDTTAPPPYATTETGNELPVNVLIVGETQNGKSTLIRQMGVYAGVPELDVRIGFGNVSCTKTVGLYHISTALRKHYLTDLCGKKIRDQPYSDLIDLTEDEAKVSAAKPENNGKVASFALVDTPGLDDSDGNDMEIMANIVGRVGELDYLNAVIYVRNINRPFGSSFTRFFDYFQRSMPTLCNGLVIVHSGYTVEKVEEFLSRQKDLAALRQDAFKTATNSHLDLSHFFMDNRPDQTSPFAVMQSLNETFRLLSLLNLQKPLPTAGLKLLKTPHMVNIDVHILYALECLHTKLKESWNTSLLTASKTRAQNLRTSREIHRLTTKLEAAQARLADLDSSSLINLGTKTVSMEYNVFKSLLWRGDLWLDDCPVEFDSDAPIVRVEKAATGGSQWSREELRGTSWRAILSADVFRSINGSATFYTTSAMRHAREIELLKGSIADMAQAREFHTEALQEAGGEEKLDAHARQLGVAVERCADVVELVKKETFDVLLWPHLKRFYVADRTPSKADIYEFVNVFDPETARLL